MGESLEDLRRRLDDRSAVVGVAGLGYVGLPLALEFAKAGYRVVGIDPDAERVARVRRGESYIGDVNRDDLATAVADGRLVAEASWDGAARLDAIVICVPTPFNSNREPDLSFVCAAAESVAAHLRPGQLVVLESTTFPGTTEEVLLPIFQRSGLAAGRDFALAYSPERVDPGNREFQIPNTPKLVGGVTPLCTELAAALYEKIVIKVVPVSTPRVAEMS
jgi:UDP-N-acetyl-D-glucosamine dehydrogenase